MNCRSCGRIIPQGMAYCPTCKRPAFYEQGNSQGPSFTPPSAGQYTGPHGANPQMPALQEDKAGPNTLRSFLPSAQTPGNMHPSQFGTARGPQPNTENLSFTPSGQLGNQFSPVSNSQTWPASFTQAPGQQFPNGFPVAQPTDGFPANMAPSAHTETSSRFLYGPSASSSFPFSASGPAGNPGDNAPAPAQGFSFANSTNTPEPFRKNPSGYLASAIIAPTRKRRNPAASLAIICLVVVLSIGGIIGVIAFVNRGSDAATIDSFVLPTNMVVTNTMPVTGPSGQKATTAASSIIIDAQTTSEINANYIPIHTTTSFTTNQTIYVSLVINSQKQAGYIMIKWYANNQLLSSDNLTHNAQDNIAFFTKKYTSPATGSAELYWCTKADCSDAQLARVVNFTVNG